MAKKSSLFRRINQIMYFCINYIGSAILIGSIMLPDNINAIFAFSIYFFILSYFFFGWTRIKKDFPTKWHKMLTLNFPAFFIFCISIIDTNNLPYIVSWILINMIGSFSAIWLLMYQRTYKNTGLEESAAKGHYKFIIFTVCLYLAIYIALTFGSYAVGYQIFYPITNELFRLALYIGSIFSITTATYIGFRGRDVTL